jgi:hypothetical protein
MRNRDKPLKTLFSNYWMLVTLVFGALFLLVTIILTYNILAVLGSILVLMVALLYLVVRIVVVSRMKDAANIVLTGLLLLFCLSLPYLVVVGSSTFKVFIYNSTNSELDNIRFTGASDAHVGSLRSHEWRIVIERFRDDNSLDLVYEKSGTEQTLPVFDFLSGAGQNKVVVIE